MPISYDNFVDLDGDIFVINKYNSTQITQYLSHNTDIVHHTYCYRNALDSSETHIEVDERNISLFVNDLSKTITIDDFH